MKRSFLAAALSLPIIHLAGCAAPETAITPAGCNAPLFTGLGDHHREVTTSSTMAQRYFDQGLTLAFAFNHDEAIRSFEEAARLDPNCAMAYWGIALCNGPHINNPVVPPERAKAAWTALQKAVVLRESVTPTERVLIDALTKRYADPQPEDRAPLDRAYAEAMGAVWSAHQNDPDICTLYAEAMMDLRPWDLWTKKGEPQPGTEQILGTLENAIRLDPDRPGAHHLFIHAVEASPNPARADASAQVLRNLVPASGHLVHMPSHIDVLLGRWQLAAAQNERAIEADRRYRSVSPRQGFYRIYMAHNQHMLAFASMMEGRRAIALRAARTMVEGVPEDYKKRESALIDPYMGVVYDVLKRFGRWDEMLSEPPPPGYLPITTAMWRFNRALAYAARGEASLAEQERAAFLAASAAVPEGALMSINKARDILAIAGHMLGGEIAFRRGEIDESIRELRSAVVLEDNLMYMEPPEWVQPVRHTLGAVLLSDGRYEEAEKVYREDLKKWPNNGWSLYGLSRCLRAQGGGPEAEAAEASFRKAWARADTRISTSCLCIPKT